MQGKESISGMVGVGVLPTSYFIKRPSRNIEKLSLEKYSCEFAKQNESSTRYEKFFKYN